MSVSAAVQFKATVTEVLPNNTGSAADSKRTVTHDQYDESFTLNSGSTAPATKVAEFLATLSVGALTIDLTALDGTNGATVDGSGLKVQIVRVKNLGANNLTIAKGASNGYFIFGLTGSTVTVPPNGIVQFYGADSLPDIANGSADTIDLTGTGSQTSEWTLIMG